ncbi:NADP-dependent malic enzyme [Sesbania bispinosa]|nr:NADP-dependent malic enzyme [Sesbania bispinosa]
MPAAAARSKSNTMCACNSSNQSNSQTNRYCLPQVHRNRYDGDFNLNLHQEMSRLAVECVLGYAPCEGSVTVKHEGDGAEM